MQPLPIDTENMESVPSANALVSVVVPCYNHAEYLSECISSVLASSYPQLEVIVVDDGSDVPINLNCTDGRVRLIRQKNRGVCYARDNGIKAARGAVVLVVDADDLVAPDYISRAIDVFTRFPNVIQVGGGYAYLQDGISSECVQHYQSGFLTDVIMANNYIHSAFLFRKEAWRRVGGYSKILNRFALEDMEFTMRLHARVGDAFALEGITSYYRQHGESRNNHPYKRRFAKILMVVKLVDWYLVHPKFILPFMFWNRFGHMLNGMPLVRQPSEREIQ